MHGFFFKTMRVASVASTAAFLVATAAIADDPLANFYGNTVSIMSAKGEMGRTLINPDHTFVSYQPDGTPLKGNWTVDGAQICYTLTDPAPPAGAQNRACRPLVARNVGDTWTIIQGGQTWTATLKAGR